MRLGSPLETFEVLVYQPLGLFGQIDLSLTNVVFYLVFIFLGIFLIVLQNGRIGFVVVDSLKGL